MKDEIFIASYDVYTFHFNLLTFQFYFVLTNKTMMNVYNNAHLPQVFIIINIGKEECDLMKVVNYVKEQFRDWLSIMSCLLHDVFVYIPLLWSVGNQHISLCILADNTYDKIGDINVKDAINMLRSEFDIEDVCILHIITNLDT
jgi:hypothetical protein